MTEEHKAPISVVCPDCQHDVDECGYNEATLCHDCQAKTEKEWCEGHKVRTVKVEVWYMHGGTSVPRGESLYIQREDGKILDITPIKTEWRKKVPYGWRDLAEDVGGFGEMVRQSDADAPFSLYGEGGETPHCFVTTLD